MSEETVEVAGGQTSKFVVAGTHSGCGKTTVTLGLIRALTNRGLRVQPFKVGPDYLDPGHLALVSGRPCWNLDSWLVPQASLRRLFAFAARGTDVAIVEGVMGMHDGRNGEGRAASTAEVASLLGLPVYLVIDIYGMGRSAAAVAAGYAAFDSEVHLAGVILNRAGSEGHVRMVREALERIGVKVAGWLPVDGGVAIPERHLGLVSARVQSPESPAERAAELVEATFDLAGMLASSRETSSGAPPPPRWPGAAPAGVRIAYAMDEAFHFYYQESLELLRASGAELVAFSPLQDPRLPEGVGALYIGGGYPELYAAELARNPQMRAEIHAAVEAGMPTYGECGGLMYLMEELVDASGTVHEMCGVFPGRTRMGQGRGAFGYCTVKGTRDSLLVPKGSEVRAHEYHYSTLEYEGSEYAYEVRRAPGGPPTPDGLVRKAALASYVHLNLASADFLPRRFIASARAFSRSSGKWF